MITKRNTLIFVAVLLIIFIALFNKTEYLKSNLSNQIGANLSGANISKEEINKLSIKMVNLINKERKAKNLNALIVDSKLASVAQLKAEDMVKNNYFSHNSPMYGMPSVMIKSFGIKYNIATENISKNSSVEKAHTAFMNSPIHRNAILYNKLTHVGVGIDKNARGMYLISVMFIQK